MKSILTVFETAFHYGWRGSTPRILDFAQTLAERGWKFELLVGDRNRNINTFEQEAALQGRVFHTPFSTPYPRSLRGRIARKIYRDWLFLTGRSRRYRDPDCGWAADAVLWHRNGGYEKPDLVMGMSTGQIGNLSAARQFATAYDVPLILEFQDPSPSLELKKVHRAELAALERAVMAAELIVTATDGISADLQARYPQSDARFETVYMCYEKLGERVETASASTPIRILHAGSLAGGSGRNVTVLIESFAQAVAQEPAIAGQVKLVLLGAGTGGDEAGKLALARGVGDMVEVLPEIPMHAALEQMSAADLLLVVKYADPKFDLQIPGKLFQYLGQMRPILGLMSPHTEAAQILTASGLGRVFANEDLEGVTDFIQEICADPAALMTSLRPDKSYISRFSRQALGNRLDELLSSLSGRFKNNG